MKLKKKQKDKKRPKRFYYTIKNTKTNLSSIKYWMIKLNKNIILNDGIKKNHKKGKLFLTIQ